MILGGWIITKSRYFCCLSEITWEIDLNICNVLWKCIWHVLRVGLLFLYHLLLYTMYKYHTYTHTQRRVCAKGQWCIFEGSMRHEMFTMMDALYWTACHICVNKYTNKLFLINLIKLFIWFCLHVPFQVSRIKSLPSISLKWYVKEKMVSGVRLYDVKGCFVLLWQTSLNQICCDWHVNLWTVPFNGGWVARHCHPSDQFFLDLVTPSINVLCVIIKRLV